MSRMSGYDSVNRNVSSRVQKVARHGPVKFTAYTEDLADLIDNHQLGYHLYVDDTQLIASTPVVRAQVAVDHLHRVPPHP